MGPLLDPAAYAPVTISTEMTSEQVQWQDCTQTCFSDSGETTVNLQPVNQQVQLQIVNMPSAETLTSDNEAYPVLPSSRAVITTPGVGYTPHSDLLRLSQGGSTQPDDPMQQNLPADLPSVSSSEDTDAFLTDVISMPAQPLKVHVKVCLNTNVISLEFDLEFAFKFNF